MARAALWNCPECYLEAARTPNRSALVQMMKLVWKTHYMSLQGRHLAETACMHSCMTCNMWYATGSRKALSWCFFYVPSWQDSTNECSVRALSLSLYIHRSLLEVSWTVRTHALLWLTPYTVYKVILTYSISSTWANRNEMIQWHTSICRQFYTGWRFWHTLHDDLRKGCEEGELIIIIIQYIYVM